MKGRKLRSGSLVALLGALILVLGATPGLAQRKGVHSTDPLPKRFEVPHKANRVTIFFDEALVPEGTEGKEVSISVEDECGRRLNGTGVQRATAEGEEWVEKATVTLDRRQKNPNGKYSVVVSYWLASDAEETPGNPDEEDPPAPEARIYEYWFDVHGGPNCDGSDKPGHPGHGGGGDDGGKNHVWGNTSGGGHDHDGGHTGHENLRSPKDASGSSTGSPTHTTHDLPGFDSYTSPTIPSDLGHNDHTGSTTPFGEDDFGDFGDTTGTPPLSDPTDPSLYNSEAGQIPQEAEDQQTLSASPADDLEPEPSMLVVALATALLLGVGGGLFLRKTEPVPTRS
jgi:hypothetical protein